MKKQLFTILLLLVLGIEIASSQAPESFFPHNVGDRWDYQDLNTGQIFTMALTNDSIGADGSHYLFYNNSTSPAYRIDTLNNVYWAPEAPWGNWLRYKLAADSCEAWVTSPYGWAWVASVESAIVFFQSTVLKTYRYAPGNPCSLGSLEEHKLASGFGLIWSWLEPNDIRYLRGCIINGDTFGILTSVPQTQEFPREYVLRQNYPNPFNPTTTIEFELPEAAIVSIRVYDLLGQQVATLTEGKRSAGIHRVAWDASGVPSGIYFCRLQANRNVKSIKMLLIR